MLPELNKRYLRAEERKAEMLAALDAVASTDLNKQPNAHEWSPLQVMDHIVMVEEWLAAPLSPIEAKVALRGYLFMTLGVGMMRRCVRMPTLPQAVPGSELDFATIKQRWNAARHALRAKWDAVTFQNRHLPIAPHPVAGPLNAEQTLDLLEAHLIYHLRYFPRLT